jgi:hypothetical protein
MAIPADLKMIDDQLTIEQQFMNGLRRYLASEAAPVKGAAPVDVGQLQKQRIANTIAAVRAARDRALAAYDGQLASLDQQLGALQAPAVPAPAARPPAGAAPVPPAAEPQPMPPAAPAPPRPKKKR